MKTIISFGFLFATFLLSQFSYATGNLSVNLVSKTDTKAVLEVTNKSNQNSAISISSSTGEMVYFHESDEVQSNFSKTFDFAKLEDGDYTLSVKIDGESNDHSLRISNSKVQIGNSIKKFDPVFSFKNDVIKLSYLNTQNNGMSLVIFHRGELVWEKELNKQFEVQKGFDLSKLNDGDYRFVFASGNDVYEYNVTKE